MEFEKAWLTYRRNQQLAVLWSTNSVYSNFQGTIAKNAVQELRIAAQEILGCSMIETQCQKEAGVLLLLDENHQVGKEGYEIYQEDGKLFITSGGEAGILYGVFHWFPHQGVFSEVQFLCKQKQHRCSTSKPIGRIL